MRESLETSSREIDAEDNTDVSGSSEYLPDHMLDLTDLTMPQLRESSDPELQKAVAGIVNAVVNGNFEDKIQQQRD